MRPKTRLWVRGSIFALETILYRTTLAKGKENGIKALLCGCGRRLEADEDDRLCERVATHLKRDHATTHVDREVVKEMVASRGYKLEYAVVYANGSAPDEEFGPEPY